LKEDLRVQKTKAALFRAFYDLLSEKDYDDITVNELCERAMVRRATFYKHYRDKKDFLVSIVKKFRVDFDAIIWKSGKPMGIVEYFIQYTDTLITYINTHTHLIENILSGEMRAPYINIMVNQNNSDTVERLAIAVDNGFTIDMSLESAASFLVGGVFFLLITWVEGGRKIPESQIRADLHKLISRILNPEKV